MLFENLLPVPSPEKRGGLKKKNSLATETETREKTAPGGRREAEQATGFMKDGDHTFVGFRASHLLYSGCLSQSS